MKERIAYIDSLRGLAVILMVQQHLLAWLWNATWFSYTLTFKEHPVILTLNFFGNFASPVFLLIAGAGAALRYEKDDTTALSSVKRGAFILACGYLLNILSPHWFSTGSWYILHTMGIAIIISPLLLRAGTFTLIATASVLLVLPGFVQTLLATPLMTGNGFMNNYTAHGGVLRLALAEGHFPVIPWIAFFIAGILCRRWISEGKNEKILYAGMAFSMTGIILASLYTHGFFFATGGTFFRIFVFILTIYPPHPPFIMMLVFCAMVLLHTFASLEGKSFSLFCRITAPIGRSSLSWFFLHIILFNEIFRVFGIHGIFSAAAALCITVLFVLFLITASFYWGKKQFRFGIEWLMKDVLKL